MARTKTVHSIKTGKTKVVPYTAAEEAAADIRDAAESDRAVAAEAAKATAPLTAEEVWAVLEAKGTVSEQDRPRPKP